MEDYVQKKLFSSFPSWCWHVLFTPSVVLVSSLVGIDSFKGTKCMFETVFDLPAGGIMHAENTASFVRKRFELHTWKTVTFRSCLDP